MKTCTKCYKLCRDELKICERCGEILPSSENFLKFSDKFMMEFICSSCGDKFQVSIESKFNAFSCIKCRSIYTYEKLEDRVQIHIIKKEKYIPIEIMKIIDFFSLNKDFDIEQLKKKYKNIIEQYHPDKVAHLGKEIKIVAEEKTKEINMNFEKIKKWLLDK